MAKERSRGGAETFHIALPAITVNVEPGATPEVRVDNHVEPTPVTVDAPVVHNYVKPTPVEVAAPDVRVDAPTVNVEAPDVKVDNHVDVQPADVNVRLPRRHMTVQRDQNGRIIGTEEE